MQVVAVVLTSHRVRLGYWLHLFIGLGWFLGSTLDHLDDVVVAQAYRSGWPSKAFEVGIMVVSALLTVLSVAALRGVRR